MGRSVSFYEALRTRARVVVATVVQSLKRHRAGPRLGPIFTLLEVAAGIAILAVLFSLVGRQAQYGTSIMLFLVSGLIPFSTFGRIASNAAMASQQIGNVGRSPLITTVGMALSNAIEGVIVTTIVGILLLMGMHAYGIKEAWPHTPIWPVLSILSIAGLSLGVGLVNSVINSFMPGWQSVYVIMTRGLLFVSGVFYVVDFLPPVARDILVWNPLVHALTLFRMGFYPSYPDFTFSASYLSGWIFGSLLLGLILERLMRRRMVM